jgi:hypothetical protein
MLLKLNQRAQTTAEYAILIAIVIGAVVAMQAYIRRGMQGRIRNVVDHVGAGGSIDGTTNTFTFKSQQYEPYYVESKTDTGREEQRKEKLGLKGAVGRSVTEDTRQARFQKTGWEKSATPPDSAYKNKVEAITAQVTSEAVLP